MKYLLGLFVLIIMTGCAVMDTSVMDTAEPLEQGHVKMETFTSSGLILESTVYNEEEEGFDYEDNPRKALIWPLIGLKFGIGVSDSTEVGVKGWASIGSIGAKAYLKYQLDRQDDVYYALMPALTYTGIDNNDSNTDDVDSSNRDYKYKSVGVELPLLVTKKFSEYISLTAALRANYNYFQYQYIDGNGERIKRGPFNVVHGGVLGNARLKLIYLVLTPEVGIEVVPVINGDLTILPNWGLTLGLQF